MLTKTEKCLHTCFYQFLHKFSLSMHNEYEKKQYLCTEIRFANSTLQNHPYPPYHESKKNQITTSLFIN